MEISFDQMFRKNKIIQKKLLNKERSLLVRISLNKAKKN